MKLTRQLLGALQDYMLAHGWRQVEVSAALKVSQATVSRWYAGKMDSIDDDTGERLMALLGDRVLGRQASADSPAKPPPAEPAPDSPATVNKFGFTEAAPATRCVRVYGYAQARGAHVHHGDLIPESEEGLPVVYTDNPDAIAAFKIEGDSMAPELHDGDTVYCENVPRLDELPRGTFVLAKWGDTVSCKRWVRVGNTVLLESLNPAGECYELKLSQLNWVLKVVEYRRVLGRPSRSFA